MTPGGTRDMIDWFTRDDPPDTRNAWRRQLAAIQALEPCQCASCSTMRRPYANCAVCRGMGQVAKRAA